MKTVYMDHAAATPVRKQVVEAMLPYFDEHFGNPSTVYDMGSRIKHVIDEKRATVAELIGAKAGEIIFTSFIPQFAIPKFRCVRIRDIHINQQEVLK